MTILDLYESNKGVPYTKLQIQDEMERIFRGRNIYRMIDDDTLLVPTKQPVQNKSIYHLKRVIKILQVPSH